MKLLTQNILFLILIAFLFSTCKEDENSIGNLKTKRISILPEDSIYWSVGAVAGEGVVLLVYVDYSLNYKFKLIDNAGNEIWTKTFGYKYNSANVVNMEVIFDTDETFSIFYGNGLKRVNTNAEIIFEKTDFFVPLSGASIYKVVKGNNDTYLCLGTYSSRALVAEFSKTGTMNYFKLFALNINSLNEFTGAVKTKSGGYLVAGSFASNTTNIENALFLMELSANGTVLSNSITTMDSCKCRGRELIEVGENTYAYLVSPTSSDSKDKRSRLYFLNDTAEVLNVKYLDLSEYNYGAGYAPFFGNGLVKTNLGKLNGIIKSANDGPKNLSGPQYDYYYAVDGMYSQIESYFINKNYSNYYTSIVNQSDGKVLIYGTTLSLGDELKLILIEK